MVRISSNRVGSSMVEQCPFKALVVGSSPTAKKSTFSQEVFG